MLFRLGDFYELFYEDAIVAARELEITLTARNKEKGEPIPMCGVPYHAAQAYIARLIQSGHRVAICEQMEEAGPGKKLVRREITRVVTPGTATDTNLLRSHENNYLAAVFSKNSRAGLAYADLSTGEFRTTELAAAELLSTIETLNIREVLHPEGYPTGASAWRRRSTPGFSAVIMPAVKFSRTSNCIRSMAAVWVISRLPARPLELFSTICGKRRSPLSSI